MTTQPQNSSGFNLKEVMIDVEHDCTLLVEWFRDNHLTLNADKCHLLVTGHKYEAMYASVGDALLGPIVGRKLSKVIRFDYRFRIDIQQLCAHDL